MIKDEKILGLKKGEVYTDTLGEEFLLTNILGQKLTDPPLKIPFYALIRSGFAKIAEGTK